MIAGRIRDGGSGVCLFADASRANGALERMQGLLGRPELQEDQALLIAPCSSIHTFFMHYPLDIAYLDRTGSVLKTVYDIVPWRMSACMGAAAVLETRTGALAHRGVVRGQQLVWEAGRAA